MTDVSLLALFKIFHHNNLKIRVDPLTVTGIRILRIFTPTGRIMYDLEEQTILHHADESTMQLIQRVIDEGKTRCTIGVP
jgi:hypothetical protein